MINLSQQYADCVSFGSSSSPLADALNHHHHHMCAAGTWVSWTLLRKCCGTKAHKVEGGWACVARWLHVTAAVACHSAVTCHTPQSRATQVSTRASSPISSEWCPPPQLHSPCASPAPPPLSMRDMSRLQCICVTFCSPSVLLLHIVPPPCFCNIQRRYESLSSVFNVKT